MPASITPAISTASMEAVLGLLQIAEITTCSSVMHLVSPILVGARTHSWAPRQVQTTRTAVMTSTSGLWLVLTILAATATLISETRAKAGTSAQSASAQIGR